MILRIPKNHVHPEIVLNISSEFYDSQGFLRTRFVDP